MKVILCSLLAIALIVPVYARSASNARATAKVVEFLSWERKLKPSGIYQDDLDGALPTIISDELLCLLHAASAAREIATRMTPDEKPPFVEGNPFLPNAWDYVLGSKILSSHPTAHSRDQSTVKVRFTYGTVRGKTYSYTSTYLVREENKKARIADIDAGGHCDFCQSGSLRAALYETLAAYPASGYQQCKALAG
ncbi:hypothetical protein [Yersinia enterocolitica]